MRPRSSTTRLVRLLSSIFFAVSWLVGPSTLTPSLARTRFLSGKMLMDGAVNFIGGSFSLFSDVTKTPPSKMTSSAPATSLPRGAIATTGGRLGCSAVNTTVSIVEESSSGKCASLAAFTVYCTSPVSPNACAVKFSTMRSGSCRLLPSVRPVESCTNWLSQNVSAAKMTRTASGREGSEWKFKLVLQRFIMINRETLWPVRLSGQNAMKRPANAGVLNSGTSRTLISVRGEPVEPQSDSK